MGINVITETQEHHQLRMFWFFFPLLFPHRVSHLHSAALPTVKSLICGITYALRLINFQHSSTAFVLRASFFFHVLHRLTHTARMEPVGLPSRLWSALAGRKWCCCCSPANGGWLICVYFHSAWHPVSGGDINTSDVFFFFFCFSLAGRCRTKSSGDCKAVVTRL